MSAWPSEILQVEEWLGLAVIEHGPILAHEVRTNLAMAAKTHRTTHVSLHRNEDVFGADFPRQRLEDHKSHHDLRPAGQYRCAVRLQPMLVEEQWYYANVPLPIGFADVDRHLEINVFYSPGFILRRVEQTTRSPRAVQQN